MLVPDQIFVFIPVVVGLCLSPGPDNLYVLSQSLLHGRRVGMLIIAGLCTGLVFHTILVAIGIATLLITLPWFLPVIKLLGSFYIGFLAWRCFVERNKPLGSTNSESYSNLKYYLRGLLMNLVNPKILIFFLAFIPSFVDAKAGNFIWQILLLGGLFVVIAGTTFLLLNMAANPLRTWLNRSLNRLVLLNNFSAGLLFFLAIYMAFSSFTSL